MFFLLNSYLVTWHKLNESEGLNKTHVQLWHIHFIQNYISLDWGLMTNLVMITIKAFK